MSEEHGRDSSNSHIVAPKHMRSFAEDLERGRSDTRRPLYDFDQEPLHEVGDEPQDTRPTRPTGAMPPVPPKKSWRRRLTIIGLSLLTLWLLLLILPIPFGTIQVIGSQKVTVADVMAAGNIRNPINLVQINPNHLEERLQHDLRVETAKVSYAFPLTLEVTIKDRKAAAVVATQFGFATLDRTGRVINIGPAIEDTTAPIISGVKLGNVLLGDMIESQAIKGALTYLSSLGEEGQKSISEINVGDTKQLVAYTVDGLPLRLGDMTDLDKKGPLSENMLRDIKARGVAAEYVDVNIKAPFIKTP